LHDLTFADRVKRYRTAVAAENAVEDFALDLAAGKED
jgi:hypothetical protein